MTSPEALVGDLLPWGREYLMVLPDRFRVEWEINPYMRLVDQPDPVRAAAQWEQLRAALVRAGARVQVMAGDPELPDMVYAMNLGLAGRHLDAPSRRMVLSQMRYDVRRREQDRYRSHAAVDPTAPCPSCLPNPAALFEAGDAFWFADRLLVGYGKRTDALGVESLRAIVDAPVVGYEIVHPSMYHMDLAFCPVTTGSALVCTEAYTPADAERLLEVIPDPIPISVDEALGFAANQVVVADTVLGPPLPDRLVGELTDRGLRVVSVDVSEFHKGGGSVRCLTNPLDLPVPLR